MRVNRLETEVAAHPVHIVPRKNHCFARTHLDRRFVTHLNRHAAHHDVVVENDVLDVGEELTAVIRFDLGGEAPRLGEVGVQKDATKQPHDAQNIGESVRHQDSRGFRGPEQEIRRPGHSAGVVRILY
jgi:hypothetical protein